MLKDGEIPEVHRVDEFVENALIAYFKEKKRKLFLHYGISKHINGKTLVFSRWGAGNLYVHPLEAVPSMYGDCAEIYKLNHIPILNI